MRLIRLLKNDLAQEVEEWVRDEVITERQGEAICTRYGIDYHDKSRHSRGYYVLIALGYLFIGLAVITLLSANWEQIPRALRMGGLIAVTLAFNGLGLLRYRQGREKAAVVAFFLGGILYGASIMLIAQIYHLGEHFPDGIYWWALGTLPVAVLLESRLIMLLSGTLAALWFFTEAGMGFYPASFPVFLLALGWLVLTRRQSNLLFLALVAGLVLWAEYALGWWRGNGRMFDFGSEHLTLGAGLMVVAFALSNWLTTRGRDLWRDYGTVLDIWVIRLALLLLLVMSFDDGWRGFISDSQKAMAVNIWVAGLCAAFAVALQWHAGSGRKSCYFFAAVYLLLFISASTWAQKDDALSFQVIDNLLLVGTGIWLIQSGIARGVSHYFYLGVATVLVTGLVRYIDLVGDYVGAAILFMMFAAILLASARYWRVKHGGHRA